MRLGVGFGFLGFFHRAWNAHLVDEAGQHYDQVDEPNGDFQPRHLRSQSDSALQEGSQSAVGADDIAVVEGPAEGVGGTPVGNRGKEPGHDFTGAEVSRGDGRTRERSGQDCSLLEVVDAVGQDAGRNDDQEYAGPEEELGVVDAQQSLEYKVAQHDGQAHAAKCP